MLENGLYDEVKEMYEEFKKIEQRDGPGSVDLERGVWQVIGFKQFLPWLKGEVDSPAGGIDSMKQATRKYATRQTKWIHKKLLPMCQADYAVGDREAALLDATDLSKWNQNVFSRGVQICQDFMNATPGTIPNYSVPLAPAGLEELLKARSAEKAFNSDKWKHHVCEICTRLDSEPCISIGEEAWKTHLNSKRHRLAGRKLQKQEAFEHWKRKQSENPQSNSDLSPNTPKEANVAADEQSEKKQKI
ncbi:Mod5p [Sugiyamaella lignohabitans]|uniref:Mod5p n=1 Tax=Sugiyamaella lignohabitans TaxID=796027 RepID=A0A167D6I4_9ASCO|nr:Mod5p [Sugiyamaella lignohabitans]ANB12542.1 Mod5p [Sugiyamaella lignohabitans]